MSSRKPPRPLSRRLALSDLTGRGDRASLLSTRAKAALADHISRLGCYPPLIVRPHPDRAGKYEILDGHHRAEVLRSLGEETARCEVWPVDSADADIAAATLNHLHGRPDAKGRARQVKRLVRSLGRDLAAARLGMTPAALRQQLAATQGPRRSEPAAGLDLRAVVFHLSAEDEQHLRRALDDAGRRELGRAKALIRAVNRPSGRPGGPPDPGEGGPSR